MFLGVFIGCTLSALEHKVLNATCGLAETKHHQVYFTVFGPTDYYVWITLCDTSEIDDVTVSRAINVVASFN